MRLRLPLVVEREPGRGMSGSWLDGGILFIDSEEIRILRAADIYMYHHGTQKGSFIQLRDGTSYHVLVPMNLVPEEPPRPRREVPSRPLNSWDQLLREEGL